jgi:hypothetical protein
MYFPMMGVVMGVEKTNKPCLTQAYNPLSSFVRDAEAVSSSLVASIKIPSAKMRRGFLFLTAKIISAIIKKK